MSPFNRFSHITRDGSALLLIVVVMFAAVAALFAVTAPVAQAGDADVTLTVRQLGQCGDSSGLGVVAYSLGMGRVESGTFEVAGIPEGADVYQAWLYWNGDDNSNTVVDDPNSFIPAIHNGDPTVTINGVQVPNPHRIGGPAFWTPSRFAYAYRSDVTSMVTGNGTYEFAGMDNMIFNNGAELLIIYSSSALPVSYVGIAEGLDLSSGSGPPSGPGSKTVWFRFEPGFVKRTANVSAWVGAAGIAGETALWYQTGSVMPPNHHDIQLIDRPGALEIPDPFDGLSNGTGIGYWDDYQFAVSIPAGAGWLAVQVESKTMVGPAEIEWVAATMDLPIACNLKTYTPMISLP